MIAAWLLVLLAQTQTPQRDARPAPATRPTGTISGVVTSADAQPRPLRRARVVLSSLSDPLPRSFVTGDDGAFRFERVPAGSFTVVANKEGFIATDAGGAHPPRASGSLALAAGQSVTIGVALPRGAVITGTVTDIDGLPAQGIGVSALSRRFLGTDFRFETAGVPAGTTDDRGVFRIYGLPPGEYIVAAQPQVRTLPGMEVRAMVNGTVNPRPLIMSQVFHPGTPAVSNAARVAVRAGEERSGIDIALQYVPLATVSGSVSVPPGWSPPPMTLTRVDEQPGFDRVRNSRVDAEGKFSFDAVVPGRYRITGILSPLPVGSQGGNRLFVWADVTVEGDDVSNVALTPQQGLSVSGQITFEGERAPAALPEKIPVPMAMTIGNSGFVAPAVSVTGNRFKMEGIVPGVYSMLGNMRGIRTPIGSWWLKSLVVNGQDLLDSQIDLRASVDDAVVTFTDRASELSGVVVDANGNPARGGWIIAYPQDRPAWFFNSRRIAAVTPDREGRYSIRNLPPGTYRVAASRDLDAGEWFDPAVLERLLPASASITIAGVEKATLNLRLP